MRTLRFRDDNSFYKELKKATERGDRVIVKTDFRSPDEVPKKLLEVLNMRAGQLRELAGPVGGFMAGAACATTLNLSALYVLGGTAAGAAVGLIGGPIGVAIGAVIGLVAGATTAAIAQDKKVILRVTMDGTLEFEVAGAE